MGADRLPGRSGDAASIVVSPIVPMNSGVHVTRHTPRFCAVGIGMEFQGHGGFWFEGRFGGFDWDGDSVT